MNEVARYTPPQGGSPFDALKHVREDGTEYWSARELMGPAGYDSWRRFEDAIERAMISAEVQGHSVEHHFAGAVNMVQVGSGALREVHDFQLTRFGAYLVFQNGDPRKPEIAQAQGYFAMQTHIAESIVPHDLPSALRAYANELEAKERAEAAAAEAARRAQVAEVRLIEAAPKVKVFDTFLATEGVYTVKQAAQVLDRDPSIETGQNRLYRYLRDVGWVTKKNKPYQKAVEQGLLTQVTVPFRPPGALELRYKAEARVTSKGLVRLHGLLNGSRPLDFGD